MTTLADTNHLTRLEDLLSVSRENYEACIAHVVYQHTYTGVTANTRFHHLKFDANGQPKLHALAQCLAEHITLYAVSSRNRPQLRSDQEWHRFLQETRRLFRVNAVARGLADLSGEAGEMLLYFLIEAVLGAPQVVAKVELKTNPAMEVNGSDGIHMKWNDTDQVVDVYFGESKLYTDVGAALTAAFDSIEKFHVNNMRAHEFSMVTKFFKGVDNNVKAAVAQVLDDGKPGSCARINHACLIGYDWTATGLTPPQAAAAVEIEYTKQFLAQAPTLCEKLQTRLDHCQRKQYGFEVFFLPFGSVQAFRDAFKAAME